MHSPADAQGDEQQPPQEGPARPPRPQPGVRGAGRLGAEERLRQRLDFGQLRRTGRRGGDEVVRVLVGPNGLAWSRVASAVSRRHGKAHHRNRLRRLYREAFRLEKQAIPPGYDVLVSPPRGSGVPELAAVRRSLVRSVEQVVRRLERRRAPAGPGEP